MTLKELKEIVMKKSFMRKSWNWYEKMEISIKEWKPKKNPERKSGTEDVQ